MTYLTPRQHLPTPRERLAGVDRYMSLVLGQRCSRVHSRLLLGAASVLSVSLAELVGFGISSLLQVTCPAPPATWVCARALPPLNCFTSTVKIAL